MFKRRSVVTYFPFTFGFLPFISTWVVSLSGYAKVADWFFLVLLAISLLMGIYVHHQKEKNELINRIFFAFIIFMLLILGQKTGWFFSPLLILLFFATIAVLLLCSFRASAFFFARICFF